MDINTLLTLPDAVPALTDPAGLLCVALVPLTQGRFAVINEADSESIDRFCWHWFKGYACRRVTDDRKRQKFVYMHRQILGQPAQIDHKDGDRLNNRRANLRFCSTSQNQQNRVRLSTNTSGFRGVTRHRSRGKWQAAIKLPGKSIYLGVFDSIEEAARAYDTAALRRFGDFARPNFPSSGGAA